PQRRSVSVKPSTRNRSGTGSIPQLACSVSNAPPFAGTSRIRFDGCDLSPAARGTPVAESVLRREAPQDEREDAAVADVLALARRVEPEPRRELDVVCPHGDLARLSVLDAEDRKLLAAGQTERLGVLAGRELQREDPHHQEVRPVDALVAVGDHRLDAEQL